MAKSLSSTAAVICMKTFLMVINILLWVAGMLLLCLGIILSIKVSGYIKYSDDGGAILLIIIGYAGILVVASTFACCCTVKGHPALLYLYGAFLAMLAILEVICGATVYAYRFSLKEYFDEVLNNSLSSYGMDPVQTSHIDIWQSEMECCGNRGYEDWQNMYPLKEIPASCCRVPQGECDTTDPDEIYTQGCYTDITMFLDETILICETVKLVAIFVFGVILACCLGGTLKRRKYEDVAVNKHRAQALP